MKKTLWSACTVVLLLSLSSCGGKTMTDELIGKWEISSKDDVDEDGLSKEVILELKEGHEFSETQTIYEDGEEALVITIDGEYGLQHTQGQKGNCLWLRYDLESLEVMCDDEDLKEELEEYHTKDYSLENWKLEKAEEDGNYFGFQNVQVIKGSELTWETDEPLLDASGRNTGFNKRKTAKAII